MQVHQLFAAANNKTGIITIYEIILNHSKYCGGLYVTAENFEAAPYRDIDYRFKTDHCKRVWIYTSGTIYGKWIKIP